MRLDDHRTVLLGGGVFGVGFGAVLDVALFHLFLQWHHLLSARIDPTTMDGLRRNLVFDGAFSLAALGVALVGGALVWRGVNGSPDSHPTVRLVGAVLAGVGAFNVFDGVVDHYVLHLHDVVHGSRALNPHWIGASLLVLGVGVLVLTRDHRP